MADFQTLNLAQVYQGADAAVAQAMQSSLMVLQASRMKQEFDREDQLRTLAKNSTTYDAEGKPSFDLQSFSKGAYSIDPLKAPQYEKAQRDAKKEDLEIQNTQEQIDERRMKTAAERLKVMNEASTVPYLKYKELIDKGVPDQDARAQVQPMYEQALRNVVMSGFFKPEQLQTMKIMQTPQFDPVVAETGMRQVMGAKDQLGQYWEERKFKQGEKQHAESIKVQIRGQDITVRGQDLTDARAKEDLAIKGLEVKENEDGTYSVIDKKTKEASPVLGPDGKPMMSGKQQGTEVERVAAGFASRMSGAEKILAGISSSQQKPGTMEAGAGTLPLVGEVIANNLRGDERQKALQAQQDWVRAKLRKESGAAIGVKEMEDEIKMYFPQIGDSDAVIKQKAEARKTANDAMVQAAGKAYKPKSETPKDEKPAPGAPKEGDKSTSKSGRPIVFKNNQWEYAD